MDGNFSQSLLVEPMIQDPEIGYGTGSSTSSKDESDGDSSASGTDSEDELASLGSEAMQDQPTVKNMLQKPKRPNQLTNDSFEVRRVDERGILVSPLKAASGYNNAIGVIVRETINITCLNLRAKEQGSIREALFNKLFNRYCFNIDVVNELSVQMKKRVKHNALRMMTKALNTWQIGRAHV